MRLSCDGGVVAGNCRWAIAVVPQRGIGPDRATVVLEELDRDRVLGRSCLAAEVTSNGEGADAATLSSWQRPPRA